MGTKAVAPTKGGKEVTAKIVKEKPAKKEKQEKKIIVSKKKKLGVDKKKQDNKKKKLIVAKKKEPPAKKKKIIPKMSDPSLELTRKLVQKKKKGSALNLKKRKEKEFSLAPSVAQKLKKKKQVLSKEQLKRREEKVQVDTTQLQTLLPSLPSLPAFGGGKKVVVKSDTGGADKKMVDYSAVINPLDFVFRVINSDKGQEAVPVLIDGGLKLLSAILEEGKQSKVEISQGYDRGTGNLKKKKVVNIGLKQLLDGALFAGGEFLPTIKQTYDKLYVGGEGEKTKITRIAAKVDKKTGKVLEPTEETYFVTIGGTRQRVIKKV